MVLVGDLNLFEYDREQLKEFLGKHFYWELENYLTEQATLSGNCYDFSLPRYQLLMC